MEVLIRWENAFAADAAWEQVDVVNTQFLESHREDKVDMQGWVVGSQLREFIHVGIRKGFDYICWNASVYLVGPWNVVSQGASDCLFYVTILVGVSFGYYFVYEFSLENQERLESS